MRVLVTGTAGFIGSHLAIRLLQRGDEVIGIDNLNDYYDVSLKEARLERVKAFDGFTEIRENMEDRQVIEELFKKHKPQRVVNLAAQPGVRYSLENPQAYVDSNIVGFVNLLEACRYHAVEHFVYASSSSVYGANTNYPFSIHNNVDHPVSLYAATKKSNELMAHTYSHLFNLPTTGLRFFTVYGPWGRPDMTPYVFAKKIFAGEEINVFNYGDHKRDFTYIDDIVEGIIRTLDHVASPDPKWNGEHPDPGTSKAPWRIYNIGNNNPCTLMHYIEVLEDCLGMKAEKNMLPLQPGDVPYTYADTDDLMNDVGYKPTTTIEEGMAKFVEWYLEYHQIKQ